ncbi:MAG: type II toxin-antitoxin system RatA family toxin [Thiobacillaceae bacterium]
MGFGEPIRFAQSTDLSYEPERVFDLVADVERYPEFLTEYRGVHIRARDGDTLHVDQEIVFGGVALGLYAVATLRRAESIVVCSHHALMGDLEIRWTFAPGKIGTRVDFSMELTPPSRIAAGFIGTLLAKSARRTMEAFTERARKVYGRGLA